jgi:hypothetical protein
MFPDRITPEWLEDDLEGDFEPTDDLLEQAQAFCLKMWRERAAEMGRPEPADLSLSCKFTSLFLRSLIGGEIRGNWDHQFVELDGQIFDLNKDTENVRSIDDPYRHDDLFIGNPEHLDSLDSCVPRIKLWRERFLQEVSLTVGGPSASI